MRYDHRAHLLNAGSFAFVTILMSGINMYHLACYFRHAGWSFTFSVVLSGFIVLLYTFWGGLASSIWNEVLQFFLICFGFLPLSFYRPAQSRWMARVDLRLPDQDVHTWKGMGGPGDPLGVPWWVMVVRHWSNRSPAYWCTDFLLVQRALAAKSLDSARKTPLVAAIPGCFSGNRYPARYVIALVVGPDVVKSNYNLALPMLLGKYYGSGMLGLRAGLRLLASFMSGMAGNITAFNTVFTYDLYQTYMVKDKPDSHYLAVGKWATVWGTLLSCGSRLYCTQFQQSDGLHAVDRGAFDRAVFYRFSTGDVLEAGFRDRWLRGHGHGVGGQF